MLSFLRNRYIILYGTLYIASWLVLYIVFHQPVGDILPVFGCVGFAFSIIAWLLTKDCNALLPDRPAFKNEGLLIFFLILYFLFYVTYGTSYINNLLPESFMKIAWKNDVIVLIKKLIVIVFLPFLVYKLFGFSLRDFGLRLPRKQVFNKKTFLVFTVLSIAALLFQYFFSVGAKPFRNGEFSTWQLLKGLPVVFIWLFVEAGLVEEFFFRAVLQSRIAILFRSPVAGIVISGLIFGLAHAPGLYLRGAESEGINEALPFYFWVAYTICSLSVAGIFLGIIWSRTKNLYLVMAIHAMVDLLPNTADFFRTWNF